MVKRTNGYYDAAVRQRKAAAAWVLSVLLVCLLPVCGLAKTRASIFTAERVANARRNIERYVWAAQTRDAAVAAAERWAELPDEQLWELVPEQALPRTAVIKSSGSCPTCGAAADRHGPYAWKTDVFEKPWKVICPECGEAYPTNDFGAYYRSGKGPGFLWSPERSDRSLLKNVASTAAGKGPDFGVDDGFGYIGEDGQRHGFIAYYCHWGLWRGIQSALTTLTEAYVFTGEPRYAHKAAVLLCRIADLYPDFDHLPLRKLGFDNSSGDNGLGKIYGRVWETGVCSVFVLAVDRLWDWLDESDALCSFLAEQAIKHELPDRYGSPDALRKHLVRGLLDATIAALKDGRIRGNQGTHQAAMARVAIVLDDPKRTPKLLDWIFLPTVAGDAPGKGFLGGDLPRVLTNDVDRDGVGAVAAPEYALSWLPELHQVAELIRGYKGYTRHDLYKESPKFRRMFTAPVRLAALGEWTPNIGDSGRTGRNTRVGWSLNSFLDGFRRLGDPELARAAWEANGRTVEGLRTSIFDAEPEAIQDEVLKALDQTPSSSRSRNVTGYGLACLESGDDRTRRALWLYYGRNSGHGHRDRLNLGLFAHGLNLLPDLGYPEFIGPWPKAIGWTTHTVSHNTVMVDRQPQQRNWSGRPTLFKALPGVEVVEVKSPGIYPQCGRYQRQCALIDIDAANSYVVDCFRVGGGESHVFSFHAAEGEPQVKGLRLTRQPQGTLAGPDVPFGDWGEVAPDWSYVGPGYQYLYDVRRGEATARFSLDWPITDTWGQRHAEGQVYLRLTMLGQSGEVVLANGDPPQNKRGNPRRLRYALLERRGESLESCFVSIVEPYVDERVVQDIQLLVSDLDSAAVKIVLPDDAVDYVYSSTAPQTVVSLTDDVSVAARFAHVRMRSGTVESMTLIAGTLLRAGGITLSCETPEWTGTIDDFDRDEDDSNCLYTEVELPVKGVLDGQEIYLENDGERNAAYQIKEIRRERGRTTIDLGDTTLVRSFKDDTDYQSGFVYNLEPGCAFRLPNHVQLVRSDAGIYRAEFTAPVEVELPSGR